jgi:hypothetical protein
VETVSRDLAYDWQRALLANGVRAAVFRRSQSAEEIGGRKFKSVQPFAYILGISGSTEQSGKGMGRARLSNGKAWVKVASIKRIPFSGLVYDLQTSTGYFTGTAHRVHNSDDATHNLMRRVGWCTLVQRVSADFTCIEQEVVGAVAPGYPTTVACIGSNAG